MFKSNKEIYNILIPISFMTILTFAIVTHLADGFGLIGKLFNMLNPFFIGFTIAYLLDPLVKMTMKYTKLKRSPSVGIVFLSILILVSIFFNLVMPSVISGSANILKDIPVLIESFNKQLTQVNIEDPALQDYVMKSISSIQDKLTTAANYIITNVTNFFVGLTSAVMSFIFGTVVSIYALLDKESFKKLSKKLTITFVGDEKALRFFAFMDTVNSIFSSFLSGLILEAIIVGILAFIAMSLLGVKYAAIYAIIICLTNVIPYIGPFIGAIPAVGITLLTNPILALWVGIAILIIQQLDANVIGPKIMGSAIGLGPIWIILAISLGGTFGGMVGMIMSIPVAAIMKILLERVFETHYKKQNSKVKL